MNGPRLNKTEPANMYTHNLFKGWNAVEIYHPNLSVVNICRLLPEAAWKYVKIKNTKENIG